MQIKMLKVACGPDGSFQPGEVRDVPTVEGRALIGAGAAVELAVAPTAEVTEAPVPETATLPQPENRKKGRGR